MRRGRLKVIPPPTATQVEQRKLTDYDDAFGLGNRGLR